MWIQRIGLRSRESFGLRPTEDKRVINRQTIGKPRPGRKWDSQIPHIRVGNLVHDEIQRMAAAHLQRRVQQDVAGFRCVAP